MSLGTHTHTYIHAWKLDETWNWRFTGFCGPNPAWQGYQLAPWSVLPGVVDAELWKWWSACCRGIHSQHPRKFYHHTDVNRSINLEWISQHVAHVLEFDTAVLCDELHCIIRMSARVSFVAFGLTIFFAAMLYDELICLGDLQKSLRNREDSRLMTLKQICSNWKTAILSFGFK